jgi:hypothetical protein
VNGTLAPLTATTAFLKKHMYICKYSELEITPDRYIGVVRMDKDVTHFDASMMMV